MPKTTERHRLHVGVLKRFRNRKVLKLVTSILRLNVARELKFVRFNCALFFLDGENGRNFWPV